MTIYTNSLYIIQYIHFVRLKVPQVKSKTICFSSLIYISTVLNALHQGEWPLQASHTIITCYYSFKIFPRFWLAKSTRLIHHNQLLMTKFGRILTLTRKWRQKCSVSQVNTASTDNTLLDLHNSSYDTKAECNNCFIIHYSASFINTKEDKHARALTGRET